MSKVLIERVGWGYLWRGRSARERVGMAGMVAVAIVAAASLMLAIPGQPRRYAGLGIVVRDLTTLLPWRGGWLPFAMVVLGSAAILIFLVIVLEHRALLLTWWAPAVALALFIAIVTPQDQRGGVMSLNHLGFGFDRYWPVGALGFVAMIEGGAQIHRAVMGGRVFEGVRSGRRLRSLGLGAPLFVVGVIAAVVGIRALPTGQVTSWVDPRF